MRFIDVFLGSSRNQLAVFSVGHLIIFYLNLIKQINNLCRYINNLISNILIFFFFTMGNP